MHRSALSVRDGRVRSAGHSALIFQCGNCLVHFDYRKQVFPISSQYYDFQHSKVPLVTHYQSQTGICFPSNVRLDSWDVSPARRMLAVAVRGENSLGKGISVIQLYRIEDKETGIAISLAQEFHQNDEAYVTRFLVNPHYHSRRNHYHHQYLRSSYFLLLIF